MFTLSKQYKYNGALVAYLGEQAGLYCFQDIQNPVKYFSLVPADAQKVEEVPDAKPVVSTKNEPTKP